MRQFIRCLAILLIAAPMFAQIGGDVDKVRKANRFKGADACAKIAAAIADLPATGGTVDARGFEGDQLCDSQPFPAAQKPVVLLLGAARFKTSVEWLPAPGHVIRGLHAGHYNQPTGRATIIQPTAGFTPTSVLRFDADGYGYFTSGVGAEDLMIDMTNVSAAGKAALKLLSVSNSGPFRNLTVINQDTGQYLYVGRSAAVDAALSDGLSFYDVYTLAKTRSAPWVRGNDDPCVVIEEANEISFSGGRTKLQCAAGAATNSPAVVVRSNGSSGTNHVNFDGVSFTQGGGTASPSLLVTYVSGPQGPRWVRVVNSTFESYTHAIEISGGTVAAGTDPRYGYYAGNRFISPAGAAPSNYYVDVASANLIITDEFASQTIPGNKTVTLTANASSNTVLGGSQAYTSDSGTGNTVCTRATGGVYSCNHGLDAGTGALSFNSDSFIYRDAANVISVRNGANPQEFDLYKSYTDAGNWERMTFKADSSYFRFYTDKAGSGAARALIFGTGGSAAIYLLTGGVFRWLFDSGGNLLGYADNTYDLGANGANRPRTGYFGTSVVAPVINATTGVRLNGAAAAGQYLRGDGTNFVSSSLLGGDLPNPAVGTKGGVQALTCTGTDKLSAIGTDGVPVCGADQTGAPTDATYITQTSNGSLSNEQALSGLTTGIVKVTNGTGVLSTAAASDLPGHASRHQNGGNDEIATATPTINSIPKTGAATTLATGWIPDLSGTYETVTALGSWAGSTNVTTLGTIATGSWNATAIPWAKLDKTGSSLADLSDSFIYRDAANVISVRNGANPQEFDLYKSYTDAGNWERMTFKADSSYFRFYTDKAGSGAARPLIFGTGGSAAIYLLTGGVFRWLFDSGGNLLGYADNTYDIGANGANRPRTGYFGTSVVAPALTGGTTVSGGAYRTATNCADSAGAAACSSAAAGAVVIDAAATSVVVSTTAITSDSEILIQEDSSLGTRLSITCNTTLGRHYAITARTAGTSFTVTTDAAPTTNPACLSFYIVN